MWIFGYGSLVWKTDFPFVTKVVGCIKGYRRRFYQHSVDHRGRPEKPGRVVTLIPSGPTDEVWGVSYEIEAKDVESVTEQLDYREKTGYTKEVVIFYPNYVAETKNTIGQASSVDLTPFELTVYIGTEENDFFAGPASIDQIAWQIFTSQGPSGTNKEYLYLLADTMRRLAPQIHDQHLFDLEEAVRKLEAEEREKKRIEE